MAINPYKSAHGLDKSHMINLAAEKFALVIIDDLSESIEQTYGIKLTDMVIYSDMMKLVEKRIKYLLNNWDVV